MKGKEAYMDDLRPIVYLVGIGMGGEDQLTGRAMDCLEAAQVVMGADRMLDSVSAYTDKKRVFSAYKPSEMVQWLGSFRWDEAALVLSGDTGFYIFAGRMGCGICSGCIQPVLFLRQVGKELAECPSGQQPWKGL